MAPHDSGDAPIYDSLVGEHGDVLAAARAAAEEARRTTGPAPYPPQGGTLPTGHQPPTAWPGTYPS